MNLKPISFKALAIIFSLAATETVFAQKWEKTIKKADVEYEEGDYAKADKILTKFRKKVVKKLGVQNSYMPGYYLRQAKFSLAKGDLSDFNNNVDQALNASATIHGEQSKEHAITLLTAADVMAQYGNYLRARDYMEMARETLDNIGLMDDNLKAKSDLILAEILTGQGFYRKSLQFIEDNLEHFKGRAITKETTVDESGKIKTSRIPAEEVMERFSEYAQLLTLKANTLRKKGDYNSSDVAFANAKEWIDDNMGKTTTLYIQNQLNYGRLFIENGLEEFSNSNVRDERFEKTLALLKKDHDESHYLAFELYETLLKQYLINDSKAKYRNLKVEYEKAIKKNFKNSSLHYINLKTIEFDSKINRDKTKNLENDVHSILSSTQGLPREHSKSIELYNYLYQISIYKQNFTQAEQNLQNILEIKKTLYGEESPEYHLTRVQLANYYLDYTDKVKEAGEIYEKSFTQIVDKEIDSWHKDYLNILNHLATYYEITDDYKAASHTLGLAADAAALKFSNIDADYGVELNELSSLYIKLGEYDKAKEKIAQAKEILEEKRKDERWVTHYVTTLETEAKLFAIMGEFDDAEKTLERSQKTFNKTESTEQFNELNAAEELASLYITLGKYSETQKLLNNLISTYEVRYGSGSRRLIEPLVNSGRLRLISGEYPDAEKIARRALDIAVSVFGKNSSKTTSALILLSEIYTNIGDYEKAQDNIEKALAIQQKQFGEEHIDVATSLSKLAIIRFYKDDDLNEVESVMNLSKKIVLAKLGSRNPVYAALLTNLAKVYISQKRYDDAFRSLNLAETIWISKVGRRNNINAASIYVLSGDIYYLQRKYTEAEESYNKAKRLYQKFFNNNHPEYVKVLSKLSKVYYMEGDTRGAKKYIEEALVNYQNFIRSYFPALSEREKAKYWNTIKPDFEFYNTLAFGLKDSDKDIVGEIYNNALLTKAILLSSSIKIRERILNSNDLELISKYNNWLAKKEQLTNILSMSMEQLEENQLNPATLGQEVEQLEKELSQKSELFSQSFEDNTIVWQNVKKSLAPNEVAVEMVRYRHFDHVFTDSIVYAAMYIKNENGQQKPEVVLLKNGKELEQKYFKFYRNSIIYKVEDRYSYANFWEPLLNEIGAYATIYLSADGVYNQINLEAIPTGDGKYVLDNSNIILVSNTKDIFLSKVKTPMIQQDRIATMFGNPQFYLAAKNEGSISALPGTEREINELNDLLKNRGWATTSYTEANAQEEQIKKLNNPKVFHIATHGFFTAERDVTATDEIAKNEAQNAQNPLMRTGLLLSGAGDLLNKTAFNYNLESGILTAYEAMNLNLDQTELVVLSACETGLGELAIGEGVYGLQRAFLVAGAKTLIMSMFKVDDEATQKLMVKFYKKWLETGKKRESFIQAKKEIRNEYHDPIYWGAFIMIGLD